MADLLGDVPWRAPAGALGAAPLDFSASATTAPNGEVTVRLTAAGEGAHTFALRADGLVVARATRSVTLRAGVPATVEWKGRATAVGVPWVAVVVPDGDVRGRREVRGSGSF